MAVEAEGATREYNRTDIRRRMHRSRTAVTLVATYTPAQSNEPTATSSASLPQIEASQGWTQFGRNSDTIDIPTHFLHLTMTIRGTPMDHIRRLHHDRRHDGSWCPTNVRQDMLMFQRLKQLLAASPQRPQDSATAPRRKAK